MANDILVQWGTTTALTVTNLESCADGNVWQSGEQNDASPSDEFVRISYKIVFNATPVAGDHVNFWIASGDEHGTELWDGGIGTSESEISTAASIAAVEQSMQAAKVHTWNTSHGVNFYGHFDYFNYGPSWQVLIQPVGEALTTGNVVHYRYGTREVQ